MEKDIIIFMPGLMGSKLAFADKQKLNVIFPSSLMDIFKGRMNENDFYQLSNNKKMVPFDIVRCSHGKDIYKSLITFFKKLNYIECNANNVFCRTSKTTKEKTIKQLYILPYDWRKEIQLHVILLSDLIKKIVKCEPDKRKISITLIGHSLGGLIQRAYLESRNIPNIKDDYKIFVKKFIGIAVPHNGAYNSYRAINGMAESICLSKDQISVLANKPMFPILYQLLPADLKNINIDELPNKNSLEHLKILTTNYLKINKHPQTTKYFLISGVSVATPIGPASSEEKILSLKNKYFENEIDDNYANENNDNSDDDNDENDDNGNENTNNNTRNVDNKELSESYNSHITKNNYHKDNDSNLQSERINNLENDIITDINDNVVNVKTDNKKRLSLDNITFEKASSILYGGDDIKRKTTTDNDELYKYDGDGCVQALTFNQFESANLYNIRTSTNHKYLFKSKTVLKRLKEILNK